MFIGEAKKSSSMQGKNCRKRGLDKRRKRGRSIKIRLGRVKESTERRKNWDNTKRVNKWARKGSEGEEHKRKRGTQNFKKRCGA